MLCGGASAKPRGDEKLLTLNLHGASANVRLEIEDISRRLLANLSDVHADLLEIASYIYAADSAISRGGKTDSHLGAMWRRKFRFVIPVRQPMLWSSDPVTTRLSSKRSVSCLTTIMSSSSANSKSHPRWKVTFRFPAQKMRSLRPMKSFCSLAAWIHLRGRSRNWSRMARRLRLSAIVPLQRLPRPKTT